MKTRFSYIQNIFRRAGYIIKKRIYIFSSSLLLPVRWQGENESPGSSPAELQCVSPAGLAEYLRGNIKSCFEDLQDTSSIYGSIPEPSWGASDLNFSWRKFGRKKSKRHSVKSGHSAGTENKIPVYTLT